jgi:putative transposase
VGSTGNKTWFTAAELAELALPGLPKSKRKVNERASDDGWALKADGAGAPLARPRTGVRGGGLEYHLSVLPASARLELAKRGIALAEVAADPAPEQSCQWSWFERQSAQTKNEAHRRAALVGLIERHERIGLTRSAAVAFVSAEHGVGASTLWSWLALIDGCDPNNRLPLLAPRRSGGGAEAEIDPDAWTFIKSDYLRPEKPTWSACYRRLVEDYAKPRGLAVPHARTLFRKLEREVDGRLIIARREGEEALRRTLPAQQRTVADLHSMALVNIDGHKFDVFVRFPDGRIGRPIMVAIQDVYSRKLLAWRIGETESAVLTRLAFADLFGKWGIPRGCVLDNGRAFASKWITGGAKSRFRFKIREEEPTGLLTALGVSIHWAMPYRGQSKPIERAFRDLCDTIAKHPRLAGAYTGNRPDAKPENYGDRAIELHEFVATVERGIAVHNARDGRRTEIAAGRSFDTAFIESYARSPIGKATPEQLRMALLTADDVSTDRQTGAITLYGNRYWSDALSGLAGKRVTVRFDPDDLTRELHVYDREGRYLTAAALWEATGFLDAASAKKRARQEAELRKAVRAAESMEELLAAEQLAAMLPDHIDEIDVPAPSVVRPVRHRGQTAAALKPAPTAQPNPQFIDRFARLRVVG